MPPPGCRPPPPQAGEDAKLRKAAPPDPIRMTIVHAGLLALYVRETWKGVLIEVYQS